MSNLHRPGTSLRGFKHLGSIARGAFRYGSRDPLFGHAMTGSSSVAHGYLPSSRTTPVYVVKAVTRPAVRRSQPDLRMGDVRMDRALMERPQYGRRAGTAKSSRPEHRDMSQEAAARVLQNRYRKILARRNNPRFVPSTPGLYGS